jgi:predicted secreted protein
VPFARLREESQGESSPSNNVIEKKLVTPFLARSEHPRRAQQCPHLQTSARLVRYSRLGESFGEKALLWITHGKTLLPVDKVKRLQACAPAASYAANYLALTVSRRAKRNALKGGPYLKTLRP